MKKVLWGIYQWLIAFPILLVVTVLAAIATIVITPFGANTAVAYFPARFWSRAICALLFVKVEISGLEHIDKRQSCVFVCNHQSMFDIFVIYGWLPVFFKWVMKAELRYIPFVGKACEVAGHIFLNRSNPKAIRRSLEKAEKQLRNGVSVVIFPEGTRTYDGSVNRFKRGAFVIATDLKLPVVPITIDGAFERMRRNSACVHPGVIRVSVHPAVRMEAYLPDRQQQLADDCRTIILSAMKSA